MYEQDNRTVLTLDAGGTNLVFSAMRGCEAVTDTFELPTHPNDLPQLLEDLRTGFQQHTEIFLAVVWALDKIAEGVKRRCHPTCA